MAHPKVKENSSIVTILKPILELNPQQVQLLEQLEYEWYRSYQFDVPKFYSPKVAAIRSIRRLLPVLEKEQIKKLKTVLQENRKEQKIYDQAQMESRSFERLFNSLSFLTLRPEQEALVHRLWEEKGLLRTEKYLEHLEATLDAEQSTAHKKYKEKQDRLFREGQENHVRFAYEHLALEEEQFKEVVEYHMKNYWRDWLPGEELKEEAEFMQTILTVKQWKKYQTDLDRRMAGVKRQMKADEKGNKFTLLWVKGLFEYTKDVLHPKYLTSRREFEKHLSSEERSLISYVREKVKEFYKERLQKDYSDHPSTEMESNRVWVARANLMPSIGPKKTKKLEKDLNRIAVQYSEILNVCYAKLKEADIASREFAANFYEEIGGTYGPNVMVHREEEKRAEELWKMNFLLVDPNHKPD